MLTIAIFFLFEDPAPVTFFSVLFSLLAAVNIAGIAGLRKNGSFLPVPDTWRQRMKLRDKYQYCFLIPWIIVYGFITICWSLIIIPALVALIITIKRHAQSWLFHTPVLLLVILVILTMALPYQLSVVVRCARLVKKGGQHYVVTPVEAAHGQGYGGDDVSETVTIE